MTVAAATDTAPLLAELQDLCARLPVPQPSWHPYVSQIAACRSDFEQAVTRAAEWPVVLDRFAALINEEHDASFDPDRSSWLTAAWQRLQALPLPDGEHPYLDDIRPALESHRLLLIALSTLEDAP